MKKILRIYAIELFGLYAVDQIASGLVFQSRFEGMLVTALALAAATLFIKPIIGILLLPLTLATIGLLKFLNHTITLYIVDVALEEFSIGGFHFAGLTSDYLDLPAISYNKGVMAYIAFSILISLVTGIVGWITK